MSTSTVAYFSMEIALGDDVPTFSGGLGVLAGDHLRAAADAGIPAVGVTLLYHLGFFRQQIDEAGRQVEHAVHWRPADHLEQLDARVEVVIGGRTVLVAVWRRVVRGGGGGGSSVPVYFLDTRLEENDPADRAITDQLYAGDPPVRLSQEAVLGLAGPRMLARLGYEEIGTYHLNEGHASLVPVALLSDRVGTVADASADDVAAVRERCVFTTHTPVPAGHDRFSPEVVAAILGSELAEGLRAIGSLEDGTLNMTVLGMFFSRFINAVAQRHGEVARAMFPRYRIEAITNGVHVPTWVAPSTALLFDRHLPRWREDNTMLRYAKGIPVGEVQAAHTEAKQALFEEVTRRRSVRLDPAALTLGVARRATPYKRNDLLLSRPDALRAIVDRVGPLQVVYSGKAHPRDLLGKALIESVNAAAKGLAGDVTVVYLEDYGMSLAALLVAGVDVWVNNPVAPHEASGTSGMKAALNGVPSISILDGWWIEGHVEGVTGWAVGADLGAGGDLPIGDPETDGADATELHRVLADVVAPLYYRRPDAFAAVCRYSMALNGSFFTTQRMVGEYSGRAYQLTHVPDE
ncbi:MAG: alpha-glucan family phosphorylase [Acidimicrobiales bacterium]